MIEQVFASSIPVPETGCWVWMKAVQWDGYGKKSGQLNGRHWTKPAHRWVWEVVHGAIPDRMVVCHKCDVKACVNPDHLFLGTQKDNLRDCREKGRWHGLNQNVAKTHCKRGHPLLGENLYQYGKRRHCRQCRALS